MGRALGQGRGHWGPILMKPESGAGSAFGAQWSWCPLLMARLGAQFSWLGVGQQRRLLRKWAGVCLLNTPPQAGCGRCRDTELLTLCPTHKDPALSRLTAWDWGSW